MGECVEDTAMLTLMELSRLFSMLLMLLDSELLTLVSQLLQPSTLNLWSPPPSTPSLWLLQCMMVLLLNLFRTLLRSLRPELLTWLLLPRPPRRRERLSPQCLLEPPEFSLLQLLSSTIPPLLVSSLLCPWVTMVLVIMVWDTMEPTLDSTKLLLIPCH